MLFDCPQCAQAVDLRGKICPACGLPLTLGALVAFYWRRLRGGIRQSTSVRCPSCGKPVPIAEKNCLNPDCRAPITVGGALDATLAAPRRRWLSFLENLTPGMVRCFQWGYVLTSLFVLWQVLTFTEKHYSDKWVLHAGLSTVFLAVIVFLTWVIAPAGVLRVVSQRASWRIKIALVSNYLTLLLVLQMAISKWWTRALLLAGMFAVTWLAAWGLRSLLVPMVDQPPGQSQFDPSADQGRRGRYS